MLALKVSILRDWVRIFAPRGTGNTTFLWVSYAMLVVNAVYYTVAILVTSFSCFPHEKIWNRAIPGHCIDSKIVLICSASINVVSDVFILILPQKIIWNLHTSVRKRIGISFFFTTGIQYACPWLLQHYMFSHSLYVTADICLGWTQRLHLRDHPTYPSHTV